MEMRRRVKRMQPSNGGLDNDQMIISVLLSLLYVQHFIFYWNSIFCSLLSFNSTLYSFGSLFLQFFWILVVNNSRMFCLTRCLFGCHLFFQGSSNSYWLRQREFWVSCSQLSSCRLYDQTRENGSVLSHEKQKIYFGPKISRKWVHIQPCL